MSLSFPVKEIVNLFGGMADCAKAIKVTRPAVNNWFDRGHIPLRQIPLLILAARRLDPPVKLTPNDFFPEDLR